MRERKWEGRVYEVRDAQGEKKGKCVPLTCALVYGWVGGEGLQI